MSPLADVDHLKIGLQKIKSATDNFHEDNLLSESGGFGLVYKGELVLSGQQVMVAVKRLDRSHGQGVEEFWTEISILSRYKHDNIVSLIGFCDEGGENILVYEYLPKGSLDKHLSSTNLSWIDRISVCIEIGRGLEHLHKKPRKRTEIVLHRDIKSANILLEANGNAKISDFGLSTFAPSDREFISHPVGTPGYYDPDIYNGTKFFSKESDIYSFGMVLLEVLCGMSVVEYNNDRHQDLSELAKRCYEENTMHTIVANCLQGQISRLCLRKFSKIAYQCLLQDCKKRPQIRDVVNQLVAVLLYQIIADITLDKKLKSHALFQLIKDPKMKILMEKRWSDVKTVFKKANNHRIY